MVSYLICYILIFLGFLFLLWLKKFIKLEQKNSPNSSNQVFFIFLSLIASTVVAIINSLLGIVIRFFADYEEHNKQTTYFISVCKKLSKVFLINMVLSTFLSNLLSYFIHHSDTFPFDLQGLIRDFFFLFVTNSYLSSIFNFFDLVWGYRLLRRWLFERKLKNNKKT